METSHTAQTASAHVTIKAASNLTADRISPPDTTRRPTTRATKKTNSNITTSRKRPTTPTFSMPTTGDIYYGDLPAEKQAQYKAERDALDEKFVSDAQKILDEIEEVEADIDSATAENSFEAEALREEIRQLELERQNAVAEALAQSGGQWNSYAQTIDNQYKALP
jgi:hypothetical protein